MATDIAKRPPEARLPTTLNEFTLRRALSVEKSFNDMIEGHVAALYETEPFRLLMEGLYDDESIEGSLYLDEIEASRLIRVRALEAKDLVVGKATLRRIHRALGVVMRRYNSSRAQRREIAISAETAAPKSEV